MMAIFRKHKTKRFTHIDNDILNASVISFKAKGILCYLLSKPDDWKVYLFEVAKHTTEGMHSIRTGIKELMAAGYITKQVIRDDKGKIIEHIYDVFEDPSKSSTLQFSTNGKSHPTNTNYNRDGLDSLDAIERQRDRNQFWDEVQHHMTQTDDPRVH